MGFWDNITAGIATALGRKRPEGGPAFAGTWPLWEINSPQYPTPSAYNLATAGYRKNEIVYSCVQKRAAAVSEAPAMIYERVASRRDMPTALEDHPVRALLERPNEAMSEGEFWQAVEIYLCVAGFSVWEIEFTNGGQPIALWPMRPDWCSFLRGPNQPLRAVRYQPHGLPPQDVPVDRLLVFMEFDPIFPMLKGLSKTAVALRTISADNNATDFLASFFQRGAVISGVLKTQASLSDAEAMRIRARWRDVHGSTANWGDIAVLGAGTEYQAVQMSFKDMDFTSLDGRDEARICSIFNVPPVLLGAKVGLSASTYSNYAEARKAFYEETIHPRWQQLAGEITTQLIPKYGGDSRRVFAAFDTADIKALQEDRTARWGRAVGAAQSGLVTRDEARQEMGLDPIDNAQVFVGGAPDVGGDPEPELEPESGAPIEAEAGDGAEAEVEEREEEREEGRMKAWRRAALDALKAGRPAPTFGVAALDAELVAAKTAGQVRSVFARHWPRRTPDLAALVAEIKAARLALAESEEACTTTGP